MLKEKQIKRKVLKVLKFLIINILLILILLTFYINNTFSDVSFEQLLYSLQTAEGTGNNMIFNGALYIVPKLLFIDFIYIIFYVIRIKFLKKEIYLNLYIKNKKIRINLIPISFKISCLIFIFFIIFSLFYFMNGIGLIQYLFFNKDTHFFEKYYVAPNTVKISAPAKKQNLIYIYVESLETSLFSEDGGGNFKDSVIPNLENIAADNVNFSSTDKLGGATMVSGTNWTIAGIVAQSAGIPLKLSTTDGNIYWDYNGAYLPGAYTLGEVLKDNDYNNYFILGSNAGFGGRSLYFSQHGDYQIYDYLYAKWNNWIDKDYEVWWGYEDSKLYGFAKKQLTKIAEKEEPFNFTILTADTHPTDGYLDSSCDQVYDQAYLNSYHCADKMLSEFIEWVKEQDFYKDTTIVIVGDHLSMQSNLTDMFDVPGDRYIYNTFINSKVKPINTKNRSFTSMDIYPTVLASLGFKIEGDRLGTGTNLFSTKKTLAEQLGMDNLKDEVSHKSQYYNDNIVKDKTLVEK